LLTITYSDNKGPTNTHCNPSHKNLLFEQKMAERHSLMDKKDGRILTIQESIPAQNRLKVSRFFYYIATNN